MKVAASEISLRYSIQTIQSVNTFLRNVHEEFVIRVRPRKPTTLNHRFN